MKNYQSKILLEDMRYILEGLSHEQRDKFTQSTILITGCAGFLGFYFLNFFTLFARELKIKKVIGLDNFMLEHPTWLQKLQTEHNHILQVERFNIISDSTYNIREAKNASLIIHAASIASPTFYRQYPLETIDANIWGLRNLLEFYKDKNIHGFLFFSSSEIYGDPSPEQIPTNEEYRGNVSCVGPRACYDESKRFGETICLTFAQRFNMPISIARPFNNYGPGMSIHDKRVPADFAKSILENKSIEILSNGTPTRTFCYIADAILGYLKVLLYGKFDYFNIGIDRPEISINDLAKIYQEAGREIYNYTKEVVYQISEDKDYLTDNPNRRCPNIDKAKKILSYKPQILVNDGVKRFLMFLKQTQG